MSVDNAVKHARTKRFKEFREYLNMTQKEMADALSVTVSYISDIENNRRPVSDKLIGKLQRKLALNMDWIYTGLGEVQVKEITDPIDNSIHKIPADSDVFKEWAKAYRKHVKDGAIDWDSADGDSEIKRLDSLMRHLELKKEKDEGKPHYYFLHKYINEEMKDSGEKTPSFILSGAVTFSSLIAEVGQKYLDPLLDWSPKSKTYSGFKGEMNKFREDNMEILKFLNKYNSIFREYLTEFKEKFDKDSILKEYLD